MCIRVCMCTCVHMHSAVYGDQKRACNSLELEYWEVVSRPLGPELQSSAEQQVPFTAESALQLQCLAFLPLGLKESFTASTLAHTSELTSNGTVRETDCWVRSLAI